MVDSTTTANPFARELEVAIAAVREAADLCRGVQAALGHDVLEKRDRSPVTVADFGSQALVCRAVGEIFPDDPIIAEEDSAALAGEENRALVARLVREVDRRRPGASVDEIRGWIDRGGATGYSERCWTLDPIDGTKGFLRGDQYAVCLALIIGGELAVGAVACPNLAVDPAHPGRQGSVLFAVRGQGAYQLPLEGEGEPRRVEVSSEGDPARLRFCESVEAAHSSHGDAARIAERLGVAASPVRLDSQTKYAVVARGEAEAYLRLPRKAEYREKIWDHAAGALVVAEAGGAVTDITGRALDFSLGRTLDANRGVIVSNGQLHEAIIQAIDDLGIA